MANYFIEYVNGRAVYHDRVENVTLEIPEEDCLGLAEAPEMPEITDPSVYLKAVTEPVSGLPLKELTEKMQAKSAAVLVSDATRNIPNYLVSEHVVDALTAGGVPIENITFFVAIGVHRDATEEEMHRALGDRLWGKVKIENHDPYDPEHLITLGYTEDGTPVEVNKKAYECDIHVSIGKTEPHEFAGFSGGRKSVLPGIASERCIIHNHRPEQISLDCCVPGKLEGNPIHEDMLQTARMFNVHYCISFVITGDGVPSAVFGGPMEESHAASVEYSRKYCNVHVGDPDIIICTPGAPLNIDYYQSQKPMIALNDVIDDKVVVAMYCECREGVYSDDMMEPFRRTSCLEDMIRYAVDNYKIQMDHSLLLSKIFRKTDRLIVYSPNVSRKDVESMYYHGCDSMEDMLAVAYELSGKEHPKVLFYPQTQKTLPVR